MARLVEQGKVALSRPVRGHAPSASAAPTRSTRSPRCRANIRCSTARRRRDARADPRPRHLLCRLFAARPRPVDRRHPRSQQSGGGRYPRPPSALQGENFAKNRALVEAHRGDRRATSAAPRRSSAWRGCWRRATDVIPIPGTKHIERLEENLGALDGQADPGGHRPRSRRRSRSAPPPAPATPKAACAGCISDP